MAMIKCPECGREISSYAEQCIGCGLPRDRFGDVISQKAAAAFEEAADGEASTSAEATLPGMRRVMCKDEKGRDDLEIIHAGYIEGEEEIVGSFFTDICRLKIPKINYYGMISNLRFVISKIGSRKDSFSIYAYGAKPEPLFIRGEACIEMKLKDISSVSFDRYKMTVTMKNGDAETFNVRSIKKQLDKAKDAFKNAGAEIIE